MLLIIGLISSIEAAPDDSFAGLTKSSLPNRAAPWRPGSASSAAPLTLIAGNWGTNFEVMPESHRRFGSLAGLAPHGFDRPGPVPLAPAPGLVPELGWFQDWTAMKRAALGPRWSVPILSLTAT